MDTKQKIGNNVKQVRKERGLSQEQLAEMTDISPTSISRLENGQQMVSIERLLKIAEVLNVGIDAVLGDFMVFHMEMDEETRRIVFMLEQCSSTKKRAIRKIVATILQEFHEP